ncbi:VOC family protein [Bradyrhizobium sp. CCGUVB1N3]|uniref:VOC family protein n=1 Tax=Bradyrhizobium sp. CCGUVB1N3 TaxID=2949629 RepID=UPI0020B42876|nr:VOC family protein [Bradyrhizobium sp. CCGUVB1N3]MCP3471286.1 VOC family protein [Bradyrhizobium sp. CCGUVB1N3]
MITGLDHVVALVSDIGAAKAAYQTLLARAPAWQNSGDGADRVLFTLDNMTLELMAPSGFSVTADRMRALLDDHEGVLASLCFRVADVGKMHRRLDRVALKPEPVVEVESRDAESGAVLHWKRTRTATELTRGVRMFFLELAEQRPISDVTDVGPIEGLDHVVVATEDSERAAALYGARLGLDLALDRSHHDWGQLMFFRCGDLIVEVVRRPVAGGDLSHDRLWGLSWRVADIEATRARLIAAGVDVSEVRNGRKPGTRVMTVRSRTCGIQTILLERAPKPAA